MTAPTYRVVLTEDGYTTASEPVDRATALSMFAGDVAGGGLCPVRWPGRLRVMTDAEYQRLRDQFDEQDGRRAGEPVAELPSRGLSEAQRDALIAELDALLEGRSALTDALHQAQGHCGTTPAQAAPHWHEVARLLRHAAGLARMLARDTGTGHACGTGHE